MIPPNDPLLEEVVALWSPERKSLGFFPEGAFSDYARRDGIHAALNPNGQVIGYVATRISSGWVHIAHLCVSKEMRCSSVARQLVDHVSAIASSCQHFGVRLKCRKDYSASGFWPKVGFLPGRSQVGRGVRPKELISWFRSTSSDPDLFAAVDADRRKLRIAVLDANVFYDLAHEDDDLEVIPVKARQSLCLAAGWVRDAWELGYVDELLAEIDRKSDTTVRQRDLSRTSELREIPHDATAIGAYYAVLEQILGWVGTKKVQRQSDMKQIAKAAASDAEFFVTRDQKLLQGADLIEASLPIRVVNPSQFLSLFDEESREHLYSPARLSGTAIVECKPKQEDLDRHFEAFLGRNPQEPAHHFRDFSRKLVAECAGNPNRHLNLVSDDQGLPILLRSLSMVGSEGFEFELLRTAGHGLAPTAVRHFLLQAIQQAAKAGKSCIRVTDPFLSLATRQALAELNFVESPAGWFRFFCSSILSIEETDTWPGEVRPFPAADSRRGDAVNLEGRFWPAKISGAGISSATVTIKPHWAAKLFDCDLAGQELFPVDPARVFNRENVFYRSADAWPKDPPERIVWFVSKTRTFRACSRLLNVDVGPASELFRRYERLGIYTWKEILKLANDDRHGKIMALHFADTEVFDVPVTLSEARTFNAGKIVVGVHPITEDAFLEMYTRGFSRFHS
ncbi:MAG: GNAT family N-acetyltransferase [Verrucomicrobia bacterium]|nr:MAG: GNAT family N-acetyltransferase [Verrucomicrobiota bacterium]